MFGLLSGYPPQKNQLRSSNGQDGLLMKSHYPAGASELQEINPVAVALVTKYRLTNGY